MHNSRYKKLKGMSLLEILISLVILSSGVFAVIGVFPYIFEINAATWKNTKAMNYAQKTMDFEQQRGIQPNTAGTPTQIIGSGGNGYVKVTRIDDPVGNSLNLKSMQIITVEVTWTEQGRTQVYTMTSAVR
jgi:Tfp pilus assembly protein PilV